MTGTILTPHPTTRPRKRWPWYVAGTILVLGGLWASVTLPERSFTVVGGTIVRTQGNHETPSPRVTPIEEDPEYELPRDDKDRLDILVLGIRGEGDAVNGGLLTDTVMLLSLDTKSGRAALTSIPRDLTVRVTDTKREKINAAYAELGLKGARDLFSRVLGVRIDNIVVVDFAAFQYAVDTLGGVTITLSEPFSEPTQWGYEFTLPAGPNTLNGEQALYYVRSRYGSSDFDRARRQQQVMVAIKDKVAGLNLASDPVKALQLVSSVRKHIVTDLNILDLGTLRELLTRTDALGRVRRYQLTTENLLYETKVDGIYELLPRTDTLTHIKEFFRTVVAETPVLYTPTPTPSAPPA